MTVRDRLLAKDARHVLHPLHHPNAHKDPLVFESGEGIWLRTVEGRRYIDGVSGLWNVLVGHGNRELADAAHSQMQRLAYYSNYVGASNIPVIELAEKLAGFAYPKLTTTFFASGGAEANESAFKTARYYWKRQGKPDKVKILSLMGGYHGVTLATMSATGIDRYWPMFEPRVPNFHHVVAPYPYRFAGELEPGETVGQAAARALETAILVQGPDTVAGFIAEPVQGVGGVIVPPDDYFPLVREICNRHDVLMIADEVITGFGRTGEWFAHRHWDVEPDILSFAKGVTSGYQPLGGIQISEKIKETILTAEADQTWMHAYTYSGHATCCAVAIRNIDILQRDELKNNAAEMGARLLNGLKSMEDLPHVGNVRGLGLMCAVELVGDKKTKSKSSMGPRVLAGCQERGLLSRISNESLLFAPPLIISASEVDQIVDIAQMAIEEASSNLSS